MLEQEKESRILDRIEIVRCVEESIDINRQLYLITWCPDPKEMPDSDFYLQHSMHVETLAGYCKTCYSCVFCVESSQMGNPHYHGWYQVDSSKEKGRIVMIKVMQRFGIVKIAKARSYKINNYSERCNALYYYKKDLLDSMLEVEYNPITKDTECLINFDQLDLVGFLSLNSRLYTFRDKMSERKYYREFYSDTIAQLK